ncbi:MAG: aspartyl protease family protein [Acidobacteria bacterium]|nr:aspartyl protease family protein [Acidobacteriota bacterium]
MLAFIAPFYNCSIRLPQLHDRTVLDSGSDTLVINSRLSESLGLKFDGKTIVGGAGEKTVEAGRATGVSFQLPGITVSGLTVTVLPLDDIEADAGRTVDGIIGYPLFSRYVVEIDFASHIVNLYEPKNYQYSGTGERIPITLEYNHPHAQAKISLSKGAAPIEAKLLIDTGAVSMAAILNTPFVESHQLLKIALKVLPVPVGQGMGGEVKLLIARAQAIQLGRFQFSPPVIGLFQDKKGFGASEDINGLIGNEILRRFKVIFDYSRQEMILEPNAQIADAYEYAMSGLRLRAEGKDFKTFKIYRIAKNSPAADAGLREGDIIEAIDDNAAGSLTLPQIYQMFKQENREYDLSIIRSKEKLQVKMKLWRLI